MSDEQQEGSDVSLATEEIPIDEIQPVIRRIRRFALVAFVLFVPVSIATGGVRGLLGLTCGAAVTMISFLWLEEILGDVLRPVPRASAWRVGLRTVARFALLCVATAVSILVARFSVISVLLGFSVIVAGIMGEAARSLVFTKDARPEGDPNPEVPGQAN